MNTLKKLKSSTQSTILRDCQNRNSNSLTRLAEKREEEEHRQLQTVMRCMPKKFEFFTGHSEFFICDIESAKTLLKQNVSSMRNHKNIVSSQLFP